MPETPTPLDYEISQSPAVILSDCIVEGRLVWVRKGQGLPKACYLCNSEQQLVRETIATTPNVSAEYYLCGAHWRTFKAFEWFLIFWFALAAFVSLPIHLLWGLSKTMPMWTLFLLAPYAVIAGTFVILIIKHPIRIAEVVGDRVAIKGVCRALRTRIQTRKIEPARTEDRRLA